jgi:hypothetical protein
MLRGPTTPAEQHAVERFRDEICARAEEIDPDEERDWWDLSLGFFLAAGLDVESAEEMATFVRYEMGYWCP